MKKIKWIIVCCSSEASGPCVYKFEGSVNEAKSMLLSLIHEDKANDADSWSSGDDNIDDITVKHNGLGYELYGYGQYNDYHIDYTAREVDGIVLL